MSTPEEPPASSRRAHSLSGVLGLTALGAVLPGSSFWVLHRRVLGALVFSAFVIVVVLVVYVSRAQRTELARLAVQSKWLNVTIGVLVAGFLLWAAVVIASDLLSRPRGFSRGQHAMATAFTAALCVALAVPFVYGVRFATAQRGFIGDVFQSAQQSFSPTRPTLSPNEDDPWSGQERVNVLLLGGDAGPDRTGTRTDSIVVASIDVDSGDTVLFSLPRNLEEVPFPEDSKLAELYPNGFTGPGDPLQWMLNAIYPTVPELHPQLLGKSDNEGADALKLGVSGALGIPVDYYVLVSIPGFVKLIDAMGGVTVNINHPVPIGGITGVQEPEGYLDQGPRQRLDGFEAMWFARGRYGLDDYDRMRRQRCLIDAVIDRADPVTLLTRYEKILDAGRDILLTDIPGELLPDFVDLAFEIKDAKIRSVVFERSDEFQPEDPDYEWVHEVVEKATSERSGGGGGGGGNGGKGGGSVVDTPEASCAYQPDS
jgi:polyisoprenyl-teichoic acid--peptidoglycan teichoic acid transferase